MSLFDAILAVLLTLQPWYQDKAEEGRLERMEAIATGIAWASEGDEREAAFLIMAGFWESRFNRRVHAGQCARDECDPRHLRRGVIVHTSITPWQLKQGKLSSEEWQAMVGTGWLATTLAAEEASRRYRVGLARCRSTEGAINLYALGRCSGYPHALIRLKSLEAIEAGLLRRTRGQLLAKGEGLARLDPGPAEGKASP